MDLSNMGNLGELAKQMQDAYAGGTGAMNQAGKEVAKDMKPDHIINVEFALSAKIDGHEYEVDSEIEFEIELGTVLEAADSSAGDLAKALEGLDVDLGDDKDAVMEQLGQPRAVGVVKKITTKKLVLSDKDGEVDAKLNKDGTILATITKGKILFNFESVLSYPDHPEVFVAIPSMEKMQKHIVVDVDDLKKKTSFKWTEKDKDGLKIEGTLQVKKK